MTMKSPVHPGAIVREDCLKPLGLSVSEGARRLGVGRQNLSNLVNEKASVVTSNGPSRSSESRRHSANRELVKKTASKALTRRQKEDVEALAALPDEEIDTGDIPEILDWSGARRGALYRPAGARKAGPRPRRQRNRAS